MYGDHKDQLRGTELMGCSVLLLPDGRTLGRVADLLIDHRKHRVVGLMLGHDRLLDAVVPFEGVARIEGGRISVWDSRPGPEQRPQVLDLLAQPRLLGRPLFLADDTPLGVLADVLLEAEGGGVISYLVGSDESPKGSLLLRVGPQRLHSLLGEPPRALGDVTLRMGG